MEKGGHYFIVGVFVSLAILALVGFTIWLAGTKDKEDYDFYTVQFRDTVSGLEEGSGVGYKGVRVGQVVDLRLVPGDISLIEADIGVDKGTPVRGNTRAVLETQGITGLVRLELSTENDDDTRPPMLPGHKYPVLQGTGSQLVKALGDLPEITEKVKETVAKADEFLSPETIELLRKTVANAENLSRDMNGLLTPPNVAAASILLSNLSATSAQLPEMIKHLQSAADQMDAAAAGLNAMVNRNKGHINRFAASGLPQITAMSKEAKGTAASLRGLADKLKDDPSQVLYRPSAQGVEIPK